MSLQIPNNEWTLAVDKLIDFSNSEILFGSFTSPFVAIQITSKSADSAWRNAGTVAQGISIIDQVGYGNYQNLQLNNLNLLQFPLITPDSYQLYYLPLARLETVRVRIWEFMGETVDTSVVELISQLQTNAIIQVDLSRIQEQIDCLKSMISQIAENIGIDQTEEPPTALTELEKTFYILN